MPVDILPALGAGVLLGSIALFPGFHFAMVLMICGPWILTHFSLASSILCMASAVSIAKCMHTLAVVYHPVSADNIASADPAQRLAAGGQGRYATALMGDALWGSVQSASLVLGFVLLLGMVFEVNLIKNLTKFGINLAIPAILVWAVLLFVQSSNKLGTLMSFLASGCLGVFALMHPAVEGSSHAMTPLLTGLFAFPVLLATLFQKHSRQTVTLEKQPEVEVHGLFKIFGFVVGLISVVLPGLGTSSLVSIGQDLTESDADYLTMAAFAESTGEVLALVLGIMSIASRSSDAAIIQQIIEKHSGEFALNPVFAFLLLGTLVVSCWIGLKLVKIVSFPYRVMLNLVPVKLQALIVASAMVWLVWHHTSMWGMGILVAGTLIHLGSKQMQASNQVFFACMTVPMILSMIHVNPFR